MTLTFRPLNGSRHPCHGLPSCQFSACYTIPFSTRCGTNRRRPSVHNAPTLWGREIIKSMLQWEFFYRYYCLITSHSHKFTNKVIRSDATLFVMTECRCQATRPLVLLTCLAIVQSRLNRRTISTTRLRHRFTLLIVPTSGNVLPARLVNR